MAEPINVIAAGSAAWLRIKDRDRKSWDDWTAVGKALIILRDEAMAKAGVKTPFGKVYTRAMAEALRVHDLADILQAARYRIMLCIEHLDEIEAFRAGLDEKQRLRLNHPDSLWWGWRASQGETRAPQVRVVRRADKVMSGGGRSTMPSGDVIRHVAEAMRQSWSNDTFKMASVAIQAYEAFFTRAIPAMPAKTAVAA
jgi:uncharacterized protein YoaH (UPF0181 family)